MGEGIVSFYNDNSPFLRYFQGLALSFIAVPGALAVLIHGLARYMDTVRRDVLWVRDQFMPPRAEDEHIPLHGASRGVPRTRFDKDERYRVRVERAAAWHRLGGKNEGLPEICKDYGYSGGVIHNCRDDDPARWATFDLNLLNPPADFSQADVDAVFSLANQYKPARSVIRKLQFARHLTAPLCLGVTAQCRVVIDHYVQAREAKFPGPATLNRGAAMQSIITIEHFIAKPDIMESSV
jgi:hypothetical protein